LGFHKKYEVIWEKNILKYGKKYDDITNRFM
jgi:hypothetical protein